MTGDLLGPEYVAHNTRVATGWIDGRVHFLCQICDDRYAEAGVDFKHDMAGDQLFRVWTCAPCLDRIVELFPMP